MIEMTEDTKPTSHKAILAQQAGNESIRIDRRLLEILVCPLTMSNLKYDELREELISSAAHLAYPIRDGIPILLPDEARETDN